MSDGYGVDRGSGGSTGTGSTGAAAVTFVQSGTGAISRATSTALDELCFNVKNYGAVGDNSTDDTTAIQRAINAASSGGIVYFPRGTYKITDALNVTNGMSFLGTGRAKSIIAGYSTTKNGFQVSTPDTVAFQGLQVTRTSTTPSSGDAIIFTETSTENVGSSVVDCIFSNWYNGVHFERAQQWRVSHCYFANNYNIGLYAQNIYNGDSGANVIDSGTIFDNSRGGTTFGVYYGSGGGLTLQGVKFLSHTYQFYQNLESAVSTGINIINSSSFEGSATEAIHFGNANANGAFTHVIITDNEISGPTTGILTTGGSDYLANLVIARNSISVASGGTCISLSRGRNITVNHNIYVGNGGSPTALVAGANISNLTYGQGDVFSGISTKYNIAGSSNAGMLTGSGVPSGSDGANGDFYFRTDGTVAGSTVVYHKQGGVWVALTTT